MVSGSPHVSNSCVPTYQLYYSNLFVSQSGWRSPAFPMFSIHLFPHLAINSFVSQSRRLWFPPCLPPCLVSTVSPTLSPILRLPCFVFHLVPISRSRGRYPDFTPRPHACAGFRQGPGTLEPRLLVVFRLSHNPHPFSKGPWYNLIWWITCCFVHILFKTIYNQKSPQVPLGSTCDPSSR